MKKEELLYRDFCKENKRLVKNLMRACLWFNDSRFSQALERLKKTRFYLKEYEQFQLLQEWKGVEMGVERAIVLAHYCHVPLSTFKAKPLFEDYIISKYGVFYKVGNSIYRGLEYIEKSNMKLKDWLKYYEEKREKENAVK